MTSLNLCADGIECFLCLGHQFPRFLCLIDIVERLGEFLGYIAEVGLIAPLGRIDTLEDIELIAQYELADNISFVNLAVDGCFYLTSLIVESRIYTSC